MSVKTVLIHAPWNNSKNPFLLRQTPGGEGVWKGYRFYINKAPRACDFLVVMGRQTGIIKMDIHKQDTLFIAGEPPAIKNYAEPYLAQFGGVVCSDSGLTHPNLKISQQGYPWFCGIKFLDDGSKEVVKRYDDFKVAGSIKKQKMLSVVCSDKQSKSGHRKRYEFVRRLKESFGDVLDLYGSGHNQIADKADAIRPYRYHIAIENSVAPAYWTEKLSDSYLEGAFPFYAGCPNLGEYFPSDAFHAIDLDDPDGTVEIIKRAMDEDWYGRSEAALIQAKGLVLDKYNVFNLIVDYIENTHCERVEVGAGFRAFPDKWFRKGPMHRIKLRLEYFSQRNQ